MQTRGLPIAAYLGALVALALAAAFVATLAIVIFLPPRPPDVMRADIVSDNFQAGYDHMIALNRTMNERGMVWEVRAEPPHHVDSPAMDMTRVQLAQELALDADQVRIKASNVVQSDVFVFRVRDMEAWTEDAERFAEEAQEYTREMERAYEAAIDRAEEAQSQAEDLASQHAEMQHQDQVNAQEIARLEAQQARAQAIAERHARAAERLAERIERRIRIENGQVIITQGAPGEQPDFEFNVDVPEAEFERGFPWSEGDAPDAPSAPSAVTAAPRAPAASPAPLRPPAPARTPVTAPAQTAAPTQAVRARESVPAPPAPPAAPGAPVFAPAPPGVVLISGFEIGAQLPDGRWLVMRQGRNWAELGWIGRAALIIFSALAVLSVLALLFARRLTRPIRNFSQAVQAVGVDPQSEPVREEGPSELRGAARAVNTMQSRLRALIADRTKTLAAVAHDMRTPLMRLRLAAENAPPDQRERMAKEIGEVEALVASFIAFARDDPAEEARVRLDLTALLQSITDDHAEAGRNVSFAGEDRLIVTGQSLGLKRLFANLVENALKYGASARISLRREEGAVVVEVEDEGPGVPADQRESVFEPFVRLNENASGAGLGLPAARSIARAHGGDIVILDGERGALLRVTLPG